MTGQSRLMSVTEAITNVLVGYCLAILVQIVVFPVFGLPVTPSQALGIAVIFSLVSVLRSYALRRMFERSRPK